ncbi:hypothetical protein MKW94_017344, partial [Papaver nudicaule]|nr:hypothetical protein [Papaver nudicaule]
TKYITVNRFFDIACMLYMDIRDWCHSEDPLISKVAEKMWERFEKYWDLTSKTFAIASILDPRFKLKSMAFYFPQIYHHASQEMQSEVRGILNRLYNEYVIRHASSSNVYSGNVPNSGNINSVSVGSTGGSSSSQSSFSDRMKGFTSFLEESSQSAVVLNDLEQYLSDDCHPIQKGSGMNNLNDSSFDILGWWKFHEPKYPIVAMMARDILAIPASSVASESVFSTSGRVIEKYRSSMLPETIEALICGQDWIRSGLQ